VGAVTLLAAATGVLAAAGVLLVVSGLRPVDPAAGSRGVRVRRPIPTSRFLPAFGAALLAAAVTRWPVAVLGIGIGAWYWPEIFGGRAAQERATKRTEAVAAWTEMLRDTISSAHGLEQAVVTTAAVAPAPIRTEVTALAIRLERQPLDVALQAFGSDLSHPTGDLVVAALKLAARGSVGELSELLGTLAVAARDEAAMRLRVEAARSRLRTAVRVIAGCTLATAVGLMMLNRPYLDVYSTPAGQVVLGLVAVTWAAGLVWLTRMGRFIEPARFLTLDAPAQEDRR
jgi:tight adherence protein B